MTSAGNWNKIIDRSDGQYLLEVALVGCELLLLEHRLPFHLASFGELLDQSLDFDAMKQQLLLLFPEDYAVPHIHTQSLLLQ